jgi:hypothetical protein
MLRRRSNELDHKTSNHPSAQRESEEATRINTPTHKEGRGDEVAFHIVSCHSFNVEKYPKNTLLR